MTENYPKYWRGTPATVPEIYPRQNRDVLNMKMVTISTLKAMHMSKVSLVILNIMVNIMGQMSITLICNNKQQGCWLTREYRSYKYEQRKLCWPPVLWCSILQQKYQHLMHLYEVWEIRCRLSLQEIGGGDLLLTFRQQKWLSCQFSYENGTDKGG